MTSAELIFKTGFGPHLTIRNLEALRDACRRDDPRLTQGSTTTPPPLMCIQDWPVEAACALGFMGWQGSDDCTLVGQVEEFFAGLCLLCDQTLGEPAACRWFLNWFDDTPRAEILVMLDAWVCELLRDKTDNTRAAIPA